MHFLFFSAHAYLVVIALWYGILLVTYHTNNTSVPSYVMKSFEKDCGESAGFSCGVLFLLVAIGFILEMRLFIFHLFANIPSFIIAPISLGGMIFGALAGFFFFEWWRIVRENSRSLGHF